MIRHAPDPLLDLVERSNQRGGRMLSVTDLIEAETLTVEQTSWLLTRIERGASWLVGARPGGAGKTTVMSALLAMLPAGETVRLTNPGTGWESSRPGECVVSYEISPGGYDAYIWGEQVRRLAELGRTGCRIVANLHADTLAEARRQVVADNGATEEGFNAFDIFLAVCVTREGGLLRRTVPGIHYCDDGTWKPLDAKDATRQERDDGVRRFIDACLAGGVRRVEDVRERWLRRT